MPRNTLPTIELSTADQFGFDLIIKRSSRRRTIEIVVKAGQVQLMLPAFVSNYEGLAFVERKKAWILKTLDKHQAREAESRPKTYRDGELFPYLGAEYPLFIYTAPKTQVALLNGQLCVGLRRHPKPDRATAVQKALTKWYREQALTVLTDKTHQLAERLNKPVTAVKLRRTQSKWGHCTAGGVIQYNWQIIAAPEPVVDYLVAHEVAHLAHRNHGKRYWRLVEKLYPDYKPHQAWLKQWGHTLVV